MFATPRAKIRGFLFDPVETFRSSRTDEPIAVFSCFGILLLFFAGMTAILEFLVMGAFSLLATGVMHGAGSETGGPADPMLAIMFLVPVSAFLSLILGGVLVMLLFSMWTHVWVYLLGGRSGVIMTGYAVAYSAVPGLLLGWIPLVGVLASLWSVALLFFGIRELQGMSNGRATAVVVVSLIIPVILLVIIALFMLIAATATPGFAPAFGG